MSILPHFKAKFFRDLQTEHNFWHPLRVLCDGVELDAGFLQKFVHAAMHTCPIKFFHEFLKKNIIIKPMSKCTILHMIGSAICETKDYAIGYQFYVIHTVRENSTSTDRGGGSKHEFPILLPPRTS
jgi:hypothetical protein